MIKEIIRHFTTAGFRQALRDLRLEYQIMQKHRRGLRVACKYRNRTGLRLHLGCGPNVKEGWVNIDLSDRADLTLDLREPLPFGEGSCSIVYSEHFLEHIEYPNGVASLPKECFRVLEPGGLFSVGVPDTEGPLLEYAKVTNEGYFEWAKALWHPTWCETKMEQINYHFRQGSEHRFAYDQETLSHVLIKAGFNDVVRRPFNCQIDGPARRHRSLYIEARKPVARVEMYHA